MKRIIIFIAAFCTLQTALAQVGQRRNDLAVGVTGGWALNKVSFNPTIKQSFHGGLTMGAVARYTCEKYFNALCALQAECLWTQLGWTELIEVSEDTYSRDASYVQIPLLANVGFGRERGGVRGFLCVGPQLNLLLSEKEHRSGEWTEPLVRPNNVTMQYGRDIERTFEYGLTGGLGMDISTRSGHHFLIEGRYYFALSDIFRNSKKDPFGRSANGAIIARISYMIDVVKTKQATLPHHNDTPQAE